MQIRKIVVCFSAALAAVSFVANAQQASTSSADKGWTSYSSFTETHDSSLGWASILNSNIGYDFNKTFSAEIGLPVYLVQPSSSVTSGASTASSSYSALGDVYARMNYRIGGPLGYCGSILGSAPTGSTTHGISTGRVGADWNNHIEHDVWHLTPFLEAGLGNSNTLLHLNHGNGNPHTIGILSYATLGALLHFQGGSDIDLGKGLSVNFSGYDMAPLGNQKIYSRLFKKGQGSAVATPPNRGDGKGVYAHNAVTSGTSSIAVDRGFTSGIDFSAHNRMDIAFEFTRSMTNEANTVAFSIGYRFGHVARKNASN